MRVVHLLRKCDPAEWGGTETAVQRLFEGLREHGVDSVVHCPRLSREKSRGNRAVNDPLATAGCPVRRYRAFIPVWGLSRRKKQQQIAVGGNLMSFELIRSLWRERHASIIHTHTLGRLGGIASVVARRRRLPLVVTIHGGLLDLPEKVKSEMGAGTPGLDWGRVFGLMFQSRKLLERADAVLTCNPKEAELLLRENPGRHVHVQPHSVPVAEYEQDQRLAAYEAFPELLAHSVLLCVGRIDPVKNQRWLVEQAPAILKRHPETMLVLAGATTDEAYGRTVRAQIRELGLGDRVLMTGGFLPTDPRLLGLLQLARAVILPSVSETFGLVILEAWAAGTPVIASRTSGATMLIEHNESGWIFDLQQPSGLHDAIARVLCFPELQARVAERGHRLAAERYDVRAVAGQLKNLYERLIEARHALRNSAG